MKHLLAALVAVFCCITLAANYKLPPTGVIQFDWQLGATTDAQVKVPPGAVMIGLDGFNTSAATVKRLHDQGLYVWCYVDAGSWEAGRPDSSQYPAYLKIQKDPDWPEYFLDIRDVFRENSVLAGILRARFAMCAQKGFDAVEPDNLQNDENVRGHKLTRQNQLDFNGWVADAVHAAGMAVLQKNGPDAILQRDSKGRLMVDLFDGILNEQCQQYKECSEVAEYAKRGKLALDVEYKGTLNCSQAKQLGLSIMRRDLDLTAPGSRGYKRVACP